MSNRLMRNSLMRNSLLKRQNKKGFTLVELVIVIAVLAIIAAIAIPSVAGVIKNANSAADASNAQAIEATFKIYEAQKESGQLEGEAAKLTKNSYAKDLLKAYGIAEIPKVKSYPDGVFAWDAMTKKVSISKTSTVSGLIRIGDNFKDEIQKLFPEL